MSFLNQLPASTTIQPIPEDAATISAATSVEYATPIAVLNPTKISGICGRLMCCLKNEQETYEELNSHLPNVGDYVTTPEKLKGEVSSVNVLRQLVKVIVTLDGDEKEIREYPVAELRFKPKRRNDRMNIDDKELKELEELEKKEGKAHINDD